MRHVLILASILLCAACGDDDAAPDAGSDDDEATVFWDCTCWSMRGDAGTGRSEEEITWCSENDPTQMLADRYETAAEGMGLTTGCDPCDETDEQCVPEDD